MRISDLLESRTAEAANLTSLVEGLSTGLVLVDAGLVIRGINPAAERMVRETSALSVEDGRLRASRAAAAIELAAAVAACAGANLDRAGATLLMEAPDGASALLAQIMPLPRPRARPSGEAVAAIFLTSPSTPGRTPVEAFVKHYALTPSETRVLLAIIDGKTPREIAAAQGAAMPTIRTHLSRLYDKTNTRGQTDIIRLAAGFGRAL